MKISTESVKRQGKVPQKPLSEIPINTATFTLRFKIGEVSVCTERCCCLKKLLSAKLNPLIPAK
jgi:predicted ATP-binding protein involved in virulence